MKLPRYSLRTFLIGCALIAVLIALPRYRSMSQRYAAKCLLAKGIQLKFHRRETPQTTWSWLTRGDDQFDYVGGVLIENVEIDGTDVDRMKQFPWVQGFVIENCPSSRILLRQIAGFRRVNSIQVSKSPISQRDIDEMGKLDLRSLWIQDPPTSEFHLSVLHSEEHSGLHSLMLAGKEFNDETLADVAQIKGLHYLTIMDAAVTDEGLRPLGTLPRLRYVTIADCEIDGTTLGCFSQCPHLHQLELRGSSISSEAVAQLTLLSKLPYFEFLGLESTKITRRDAIELQKTMRCNVGSDFGFDAANAAP